MTIHHSQARNNKPDDKAAGQPDSQCAVWFDTNHSGKALKLTPTVAIAKPGTTKSAAELQGRHCDLPSKLHKTEDATS